jgi:serine/threonine protein phosphatase PrpC
MSPRLLRAGHGRDREADLEPDRREVTTSPGEIFVLCSHAITATLDDAAIASVLRRRSLQRRCHERS